MVPVTWCQVPALYAFELVVTVTASELSSMVRPIMVISSPVRISVVREGL